VDNGTRVYQWKKPVSITDTYGCGAALAGGFLAYLALDKPVDECINAGLYCAYEILQRRGCQFPDKQAFTNELYYDTNEEE
jgi:sugar/nucleoside kinase (ribokinase family)